MNVNDPWSYNQFHTSHPTMVTCSETHIMEGLLSSNRWITLTNCACAGTATSSPPYQASRLPLWARSVSMFSCFLVSGLMHELIFHNMTKSKPTWEVTFFFVLNGAAAILEGALRRKTRLRLPKYVSTPLTITFVLVTAIWFFYPPLIDSGTADKAIGEFQYFFQTLYHMIGAL